MSIKELTPGQNVYIAQGYPTSNFLTSPNLFISRYTGVGDIYRTLMQFYIPGTYEFQIASLNAANLILYVYRNEIPAGSINASVYRLLNNFNESTVTWNTQPPFAAVADGVTSVASGFTGALDIDITNLVQGWYDGSIVNNGIVIRGDETQNALVGFRGTQYNDSSTWPKLVIDYVGGIQTIYPVQTISVPTATSVPSTAINLGGTEKDVTFLITVPASVQVSAIIQLSADGITYFNAASSLNNTANFAISIESAVNFVRVMLSTNSGSTQSIDVTAVTWEEE